VLANITKRSRTKQRITKCVKQHIAIGVSNTPLCMWNLYPSQHQAQSIA
jgi:hypothetical protein